MHARSRRASMRHTGPTVMAHAYRDAQCAGAQGSCFRRTGIENHFLLPPLRFNCDSLKLLTKRARCECSPTVLFVSRSPVAARHRYQNCCCCLCCKLTVWALLQGHEAAKLRNVYGYHNIISYYFSDTWWFVWQHRRYSPPVVESYNQTSKVSKYASTQMLYLYYLCGH